MTYEEKMNELAELRRQVAALEAEMHKPEPEPPKPEPTKEQEPAMTAAECAVLEMIRRDSESRNQMSGALRRRLDENKTADIFWRRGQLN